MAFFLSGFDVPYQEGNLNLVRQRDAHAILLPLKLEEHRNPRQTHSGEQLIKR